MMISLIAFLDYDECIIVVEIYNVSSGIQKF